ncbi:MAG TPA: phytoene/squalene synthase family protein, partial [Pirellulales bacterium]|nr:phytoene/squalene synthase family protein [Pirellulales bacterium]
MSFTLEASYAHCQRIARVEARNFYYSFLALPRAKRLAMCALYAYLRRTDDLGDNPRPVAERQAALARWRQTLDRALAGSFDSPLFVALADTVCRYEIPPEYLYVVIDGVEMDLADRTYETFAELADYCYKVASVVGLACIHIWGFSDERALLPARRCGLAFQLTNILRDLKEDASNGRIYLPLEDLRQFQYSADDLRHNVRDARFRALMRYEIGRAEGLYLDALELERYLGPDGRASFGAIFSTYRALLERIKRLDGDVFTRRVSLSPWHKWGIAARWLLPRP